MIGPKISMELRRKTETDDGMGGKILTWAGLRNIGGVLATIRGDERLSADKLTVIASHKFYVDYPIGETITEEDEFYYGTRQFKIIFVDNIGVNQDKILKITLKEET